jgi:hypothetical protein
MTLLVECLAGGGSLVGGCFDSFSRCFQSASAEGACLLRGRVVVSVVEVEAERGSFGGVTGIVGLSGRGRPALSPVIVASYRSTPQCGGAFRTIVLPTEEAA